MLFELNDCKLVEMWKYGVRNPNLLKKRDIQLPYVLYAPKSRIKTRIGKNFSNVANDLKRTQNMSEVDFEHLNTLTRVRARVVTRTRTLMRPSHRQRHKEDMYQLSMIYDTYYWRYHIS